MGNKLLDAFQHQYATSTYQSVLQMEKWL